MVDFTCKESNLTLINLRTVALVLSVNKVKKDHSVLNQ